MFHSDDEKRAKRVNKSLGKKSEGGAKIGNAAVSEDSSKEA